MDFIRTLTASESTLKAFLNTLINKFSRPALVLSWTIKDLSHHSKSILPASSDTVESEGRQINQCWITYREKGKIQKIPFPFTRLLLCQSYTWKSLVNGLELYLNLSALQRSAPGRVYTPGLSCTWKSLVNGLELYLNLSAPQRSAPGHVYTPGLSCTLTCLHSITIL